MTQTAHSAIDRTILPVEKALYASDCVFIGSFQCAPSDPHFEDSGPTRNHIFVFPRTTIAIEHEHRRPFISTPHNVTFYNRGQQYRRSAVEPETGDVCDFFAVSDDVLFDALRARDLSAAERREQPFSAPYAQVPASTFRSERALIDRVLAGEADELEVDEAVMWLLDSLLDSVADDAPIASSARERVEHAKRMLATALDRPLTIEEIAGETGTSLYYLCKIFRRHTGMTMSAYRLELRLRLAYDDVRGSRDFLATALRLGFSSHSHFTSAFRSYFGVTPSALRGRSS
ncbi:MAG: helix-turn-helix transcriptional regulator [Thermoanaerobaculia bacterium]|nr:helix-turn-helix transcriptional regulator [Thermoanaerobaculia bacterium]